VFSCDHRPFMRLTLSYLAKRLYFMHSLSSGNSVPIVCCWHNKVWNCCMTVISRFETSFCVERVRQNNMNRHYGPIYGQTYFNKSISELLGYVVVQWLRHCTTNREAASSTPDGVTGFFHWHNHSGHTMALGSTQPLTEMSTRSISYG
jgi:hypothetical protein